MTVSVKAGSVNTDGASILYRNLLQEGTLSYSSQAVWFEAANIIEYTTFNAWKPTSVPATVSVDLGSAISADCVGISAHNMGTSGASYNVRYSTDGVTWSNAFTADAALSDEDVMVVFAPVSARYWQIRIVDAVASIGYVAIGPRLVFPCSPLSGHRPLHHARDYVQMVSSSVNGQMLGNRINSVSAQTSIDFGLLERDFAENDMLPFEYHYNQGRGFFYCGSPSVTPKDFGYCWRPNGGDVMNITWEEGEFLSQVDFEVASYVSA